MGLKKRLRTAEYKEQQIREELLKRVKEDLRKNQESKDENNCKHNT